MVGPAGPFFGAGRFRPEKALLEPLPPLLSSSSPSAATGSLENAGSAPVLRCTPGLGTVPPLGRDGAELSSPGGFVGFATAAAFLGGGRKELKALNRLAPAAVLARFAGGSSFGVVSALGPVPARLTIILPEPTSFWKGFLEVEVAAGAGVGFVTVSESDSESE